MYVYIYILHQVQRKLYCIKRTKKLQCMKIRGQGGGEGECLEG